MNLQRIRCENHIKKRILTAKKCGPETMHQTHFLLQINAIGFFFALFVRPVYLPFMHVFLYRLCASDIRIHGNLLMDFK